MVAETGMCHWGQHSLHQQQRTGIIGGGIISFGIIDICGAGIRKTNIYISGVISVLPFQNINALITLFLVSDSGIRHLRNWYLHLVLASRELTSLALTSTELASMVLKFTWLVSGTLAFAVLAFVAQTHDISSQSCQSIHAINHNIPGIRLRHRGNVYLHGCRP